MSKRKEILSKKIYSQVLRAVEDFNMIVDGDRVMVCMSGGKDSYAMLEFLRKLQEIKDFYILAVNLDQKQPGTNLEPLKNYLKSSGVEWHIIEQDTYSVVKRLIPEHKTKCSLCSRLRRGALYKAAKDFKIDKIALGHHIGDALETFFMNLFFGGKLKSMPAKLYTDDGSNCVIRPLMYCYESELRCWADYKMYPIVPCSLCGSESGSQRALIKKMLEEWEHENPPRKQSVMFKALQNIVPSHLLDRNQYNFDNKNVDEGSCNEISPNDILRI